MRNRSQVFEVEKILDKRKYQKFGAKGSVFSYFVMRHDMLFGDWQVVNQCVSKHANIPIKK